VHIEVGGGMHAENEGRSMYMGEVVVENGEEEEAKYENRESIT
jgi:hypothetical protein